MRWFKRKEIGMFAEDRAGRQNKSRWVKLSLFASFIILSFFWFVFYSNYFTVTEYEVGELNVLSREAVAGEIEAYFNRPKDWPWGNKNILTVDPGRIENHLADKFFVENVTVDKIYPNILRLNIRERQRSVVLVTKTGVYIIDDYGVVTDLADSETASATMSVLTDPSPVDMSKEVLIISSVTSTYDKGQIYVESNKVRQWLDLTIKLRDAGIWFKGLDIGLEPDTDTLNLVLKENISVLIELDDTVYLQIETLRQFLNTKPDLGEVREYIDIRVPGKIYYK